MFSTFLINSAWTVIEDMSLGCSEELNLSLVNAVIGHNHRVSLVTVICHGPFPACFSTSQYILHPGIFQRIPTQTPTKPDSAQFQAQTRSSRCCHILGLLDVFQQIVIYISMPLCDFILLAYVQIREVSDEQNSSELRDEVPMQPKFECLEMIALSQKDILWNMALELMNRRQPSLPLPDNFQVC